MMCWTVTSNWYFVCFGSYLLMPAHNLIGVDSVPGSTSVFGTEAFSGGVLRVSDFFHQFFFLLGD